MPCRPRCAARLLTRAGRLQFASIDPEHELAKPGMSLYEVVANVRRELPPTVIVTQAMKAWPDHGAVTGAAARARAARRRDEKGREGT